MKILKEGTPSQWAVVVKCTGEGNEKYGCGAELEVEEVDLKHTYTSCMGRFEENFVTFKCPCCGKHTDLKPDEVPSIVYHRVIKQKIYVPDRDGNNG
jgi:Zn finger protein HypA/HybF involved in hydrogenase expression